MANQTATGTEPCSGGVATCLIALAALACGSLRMPRGLSPGAAFFGTAAVFAGLFFAAGAPTPLLVQYQHAGGFPPGILAVAFAAYPLALLAALVTAGSLSDHLGRRPVIAGALVIELAAMLVFLVAPNIGWVIAGRVIQGLATGVATSAFSAAVIELAPPEHKRLGTVIIGSAAAGGLGIGALLTGAAVQFTSHANTIVFAALSAAMTAGIAVAMLSHETAPLRPGAARSLIPNVRVPDAARRELAAGVAGPRLGMDARRIVSRPRPNDHPGRLSHPQRAGRRRDRGDLPPGRIDRRGAPGEDHGAADHGDRRCGHPGRRAADRGRHSNPHAAAAPRRRSRGRRGFRRLLCRRRPSHQPSGETARAGGGLRRRLRRRLPRVRGTGPHRRPAGEPARARPDRAGLRRPGGARGDGRPDRSAARRPSGPGGPLIHNTARPPREP